MKNPITTPATKFSDFFMWSLMFGPYGMCTIKWSTGNSSYSSINDANVFLFC